MPTVSSHPIVKQIVFGSRKSGTARIWRIDIDGKNLTQLTEERKEFGDFTPHITPDGKTVIFQEYASGTNAQTAIRQVSIEGGKISTVYENDKFNLNNNNVSPDGKYLIYTSYRKVDFDKKIRVVELKEDNTVGKMIKVFDADSINSYIWSPDGKSLTVLSSRNGTPNLWELPLDGDEASLLTNFKSGRIFNYTWSADGKQLYVVRGTVNNDLILIGNKK